MHGETVKIEISIPQNKRIFVYLFYVSYRTSYPDGDIKCRNVSLYYTLKLSYVDFFLRNY